MPCVTTTIYCTAELKRKWPKPLAREWSSSYPHLFDASDLEQAENQPQHHFNEWLAAVFLFHRDGMFALVEKYHLEQSHKNKFDIVRKLIGKEGQAFLLDDICEKLGIMPPDLFVYSPDFSRFRFVEVKGPRDKMCPSGKRV